jgi:glycosyltransferase involved in cell wall biosynthesis
MKIGFDYTSTIGIGGNSTYARELIYNLAKIDKKNQYFLYYYFHDFLLGRVPRETDNKNFKSIPVCISQLKFPIPSNVMKLINKITIKIFSKLNKIDIFHFSDPLIFVEGSYKSIVTLHDLSVLYNSDWAKKTTVDFYRKNIKNILSKASKIIAVSNFTKNDAIKTLNIDEKKITVVYEGVDSGFYPNLDKNYLKEKFNLENYILYVGALSPRKNTIGLLDAYSRLNIELRKKYNLVLVGVPRDGIFFDKLNKVIKELKINDQVKQFNKITNNDLPKIYSGAKFFIYPSFFEGFGLPILESLSCGVPVITSNTSSLPEVAGSAGVLVNPENIEEMKLAMEKMLLDGKLYQNIKDKCSDQAGKFKWQKTAKETMAVYEEVYKN